LRCGRRGSGRDDLVAGFFDGLDDGGVRDRLVGLDGDAAGT
jgi:hypothetical protein